MSAARALDLETPVREGFTTVTTFVPKLLGFLVILVVGYFVAKLLAKVVAKLLSRAGLDRAVERGGIKRVLANSSYDTSEVVAKLVFFALFVPVLAAAIDALGVQALRQPMAAFIALIPRMIVAIVLVLIGAVLAATAKRFLSNTLGGLSYGSILANAAAVLILFGFVKAALDQVGIATVVTTALLYTVFAAVAGVIVVGVGGGLIKPMQSRWESILDKADSDKDKIQARTTPGGRDASPWDSGSRTGETTSMDAPTARLGRPRT